MRWTSLHFILLVLAQILFGNTGRQTDPVDRIWLAQEPETLRPGDVFVNWEENEKYERAYALKRRRLGTFTDSRRSLFKRNQVYSGFDRVQDLLGATLRKHSRRRLGGSGMNREHQRFRHSIHKLRRSSKASSEDIGEKYENYGAKYEDTTRFRPLSSFNSKNRGAPAEKKVSNCDEGIKGTNGDDYQGCQETTVGGLPCQKWASQRPHAHPFHPQVFMDKHLKHNYCRNPNGKRTIWCFTTDPKKRWDYCSPVDTSSDTQVGSRRPRHRRQKHKRRRRRRRRRSRRHPVGRKRRRKKKKQNLKDMSRADLMIMIQNLRGENHGIKKRLNHCPSLAFPDVVIDCGVYKKLKGNTRRCYGQDEGCVGAGWFSKVRTPKSKEHPPTVNAIAICRNQGYSHVDKVQYGGNFNIHCLYPGDRDDGKPNHKGGPLRNFGQTVSWRCAGSRTCKSVIPKEGEVAGMGNVKKRDPDKAPACPHLPRHVIDCGEYQAIGNDRECHKKGAGCVGQGWFSKKQGRPHTVNAIAICRNRGYDGVDPKYYGGNWNMHCRYPGNDRKASPNHNGGSLNDFGRSVVWKCVGAPKCGEAADAVYQKIKDEHIAPVEPGAPEDQQDSIATLVGAHSCQSKEISGLTRADGGLLWYNGEKLFYEGDNGVVVAQSPTLTGIHLYKDGHPENIIGDSQNGKMYRLCHDCGKNTNKPLLEHKSKTADTYVEINQLQCLEGGDDSMKFLANVNLPKSYYMRLPYFHAVGAGEVVFMDDHSKWHALELICSKTPTVKLLGENEGKFDFNKCGRGFATGIMEKVAGQYHILFFSSKTEISKKQIPSGDSYVMFTTPMHGTRECSFAVDYRRGLFFYHAQSIGGDEELLEYCVADINKLDGSQQAAVAALDGPMEFTSGNVNVDGHQVKQFGDTMGGQQFRNIVQKVEDRLHLGLAAGRRTMNNQGANGEVSLSGTEGESTGMSFFEGIKEAECIQKDMKEHIESDGGLTWTDGLHVYYEGTKGIVRASSGSLENMAKCSDKHLENVIADPLSGKMYRLCYDCGLNAEKQILKTQGKEMKVNELLCLNKELGGMKKVKLPKTIAMKWPYFHAVGNGEVAFMDNTLTWYIMKLSCDKHVHLRILGKNEGDMAFRQCKSKYSSGVLEKEDDQYRVVYFSAKAQVSKKNIPNGAPTTVFMLKQKQSSNECSLALDYQRMKFYYYAEGINNMTYPLVSCPANLRAGSKAQQAKQDAIEAKNSGEKLQKEMKKCKKEMDQAYKEWRELRDKNYGNGTRGEKKELDDAHKKFLKTRLMYEAAKNAFDENGDTAQEKAKEAEEMEDEQKMEAAAEGVEKAKMKVEKAKLEEKKAEVEGNKEKIEIAKKKVKIEEEIEEFKEMKAKTVKKEASGEGKNPKDDAAKKAGEDAKEEAKKIETEAMEEARKMSEAAKKDEAEAEKDEEEAKRESEEIKEDTDTIMKEETEAKKDEDQADKEEKKAKEIAKNIEKMTKKETEKDGVKEDVEKSAEDAKSFLKKQDQELKSLEQVIVKTNGNIVQSDNSHVESQGKEAMAKKIDEFFGWLKGHFQEDGNYFKGQKSSIEAEMKKVRKQLVALAGVPGNKAREKKIELEEKMMELEHRERLRQMRERMMLSLMREREKERLRRWKSQLKRYTAKDTEAAKKKCAELRKKIRDAEMRMKMRDMKLRMMKKTEKMSEKLEEKKQEKDEKREIAMKVEEAKVVDKKLQKSIKKAEKSKEKQLKKLVKSGVPESSSKAKKVKKSYDKVIKKIEKKDKVEKKILKNKYGPDHYEKRLKFAEDKMDRMHSLILYLQKELKQASGKEYDMQKAPKSKNERKHLKAEVNELKGELKKKTSDVKMQKLQKKLDKKLKKDIKKEKKKYDEKLKQKRSKDKVKVAKALNKAIKQVAKHTGSKKLKKLDSWYSTKCDDMSKECKSATYIILTKLNERIRCLAKEVKEHRKYFKKLQEKSGSNSDKKAIRKLVKKARKERKERKDEKAEDKDDDDRRAMQLKAKEMKAMAKKEMEAMAKSVSSERKESKKSVKKALKEIDETSVKAEEESSSAMEKFSREVDRASSEDGLDKLVKEGIAALHENPELEVATDSTLHPGRCSGDPSHSHTDVITSSQCADIMNSNPSSKYASFNAIGEVCDLFHDCNLSELRDKDDFVTLSAQGEDPTAEAEAEDSKDLSKKLTQLESEKDPEQVALEKEIDMILASNL